MKVPYFALLFGAALLMAAPANATITGVTAGEEAPGDNVINNVCSLNTSSGAVITGCLNGDHTAVMDFYSNENVVFGAGGQATVLGADGNLQTLTLDPINFVLNELILNIEANANGYVKFCDNSGCWGTLFSLSQNGSNFFDVSFSPAADFLTVSTYANSDGTGAAQLIADTKQWRVAVSPSTTPVPEPASLAILGAGLILMGWSLHRSRKIPQQG